MARIKVCNTLGMGSNPIRNSGIWIDDPDEIYYIRGVKFSLKT